MSYRVKIDPKVTKFLTKLPNNISEQIYKRLKLLKTETPFHYLEHFEREEVYKFRIGNYRALVDVDSNRKIIFIRALDHRSRIYKRKS